MGATARRLGHAGRRIVAYATDPAARAARRRALAAARATRARRAPVTGLRCPCCFGERFDMRYVLGTDLIDAWELEPDEVAYINRQQGYHCAACGSSLRTMALAHAIVTRLGFTGPLAALPVRHPALRVLEINRAGQLTQFLAAFPRHTLTEHPHVDMHALRYPSGCFDLVVHSDTLEHVRDPRAALVECLRVTRPDGFVAFTVPVVHGRLSRSRADLPRSFHASEHDPSAYPVETEFGADLWADVLAAGAGTCDFVALEFPAGVAVVATPRPAE